MNLTLTDSKSGFVVNENYPFLGVSPDAVVHDTQEKNPFGLAEVKCPYSFRNQTPFEAAQSTSFCCELVEKDNTTFLKLKHSHPYYCQVQGQNKWQSPKEHGAILSFSRKNLSVFALIQSFGIAIFSQNLSIFTTTV